MIWIPVIFLCMSNGTCGFMQGTPTYTERSCNAQLESTLPVLQADVNVTAFDGTCVSAVAI